MANFGDMGSTVPGIINRRNIVEIICNGIEEGSVGYDVGGFRRRWGSMVFDVLLETVNK